MKKLALAAAAVLAGLAPAVAQPLPARPPGGAAGPAGLGNVDLAALFPASGWVATPAFYPGDPVTCSAMFMAADGSRYAYLLVFEDGTRIAEFRLTDGDPDNLRIFSVRVTPEWSAVARHQLQDGVAVARGPAAAAGAGGGAGAGNPAGAAPGALPPDIAAARGLAGPPGAAAGGVRPAGGAGAIVDPASDFVSGLSPCPVATAPETEALSELFPTASAGQ